MPTLSDASFFRVNIFLSSVVSYRMLVFDTADKVSMKVSVAVWLKTDYRDAHTRNIQVLY